MPADEPASVEKTSLDVTAATLPELVTEIQRRFPKDASIVFAVSMARKDGSQAYEIIGGKTPECRRLVNMLTVACFPMKTKSKGALDEEADDEAE